MNNYRPAGRLTPAVKFIIIANVVMFVLSSLWLRTRGIDLSRVLGLYMPQSDNWRIYQYVTHMFMHSNQGIGHIFFNMFAVFMFGRILESVWGSKRFILFYLLTGLGAAFLHSLIGWIRINSMQTAFAAFQAAPAPQLLAEFVHAHIAHPAAWVWEFIDAWGENPAGVGYVRKGMEIFQVVIRDASNIPTVGASGAVFGLLVAFGMLFPNTELFLMFIPIPVKAKYFVIGYGLLELYLAVLNQAGDNVAHFAHLGGLVFGYILVKLWNRGRYKFY